MTNFISLNFKNYLNENNLYLESINFDRLKLLFYEYKKGTLYCYNINTSNIQNKGIVNNINEILNYIINEKNYNKIYFVLFNYHLFFMPGINYDEINCIEIIKKINDDLEIDFSCRIIIPGFHYGDEKPMYWFLNQEIIEFFNPEFISQRCTNICTFIYCDKLLKYKERNISHQDLDQSVLYNKNCVTGRIGIFSNNFMKRQILAFWEFADTKQKKDLMYNCLRELFNKRLIDYETYINIFGLESRLLINFDFNTHYLPYDPNKHEELRELHLMSPEQKKKRLSDMGANYSRHSWNAEKARLERE